MANKYDIVIVIVDHSRKLASDAVDSLASSTGKAAAPDCLMKLSRQSDGSSLLEVVHRDAETQTYQMKLYGDDDADHGFGWWIIASGDATTQRRKAAGDRSAARRSTRAIGDSADIGLEGRHHPPRPQAAGRP